MNWKSYLAGIVVAALVAAGATWQVQSWRYQAQLATIVTSHQIEIIAREEALETMKDAAIHQLRVQQTQQREQARRLATLDAKHYKELRHAQNEATRLRADLAAGRRRLYVDTVRAANAASGDPVPGNAGTAGVDDGAVRTHLHPTTARRLVGITVDADECARKLIALQEWRRIANATQ